MLGRPVIASNCSGNVEQIHRYGAEPLMELSAEEIADGILQAIEHPGRLGMEQMNQNELFGHGSQEQYFA